MVEAIKLNQYDFSNEIVSNDGYLTDFEKILSDLSKVYKEFPLFMIEIKAEK